MELKALKGTVVSYLTVQSLEQSADMKPLIFFYQLLSSDRNSDKIFTKY